MPRKTLSLEAYNQLSLSRKRVEVNFSEDTIRSLFGHEAAEDETIGRLREYYVKTSLYDSLQVSVK